MKRNYPPPPQKKKHQSMNETISIKAMVLPYILLSSTPWKI